MNQESLEQFVEKIGSNNPVEVRRLVLIAIC